jgi:hypothetical protein
VLSNFPHVSPPLVFIVVVPGSDVGLSTGCPISRGFLQFLHKRSLNYLKQSRQLFVASLGDSEYQIS